MRGSLKRVPLGWIVGLLVVILVGALPAVWASPLAQPMRQSTIPSPDPTPTPRPLECKLLEPCQSTTVVLPIKNEGTLPMQGCVVRLEQVAGIEYLVGGQLLAAPFTLDVANLLPGESVNLQYDIRLMCDDPSVVPCQMYIMDNTLVCGDQATLVDQICIESPCPVLPSVGK